MQIQKKCDEYLMPPVLSSNDLEALFFFTDCHGLLVVHSQTFSDIAQGRLGTAPGYLQDLEKSQPPGTNCSACAGCVKDISEATARFNACWQVNAERKETDFRI